MGEAARSGRPHTSLVQTEQPVTGTVTGNIWLPPAKLSAVQCSAACQPGTNLETGQCSSNTMSTHHQRTAPEQPCQWQQPA